MSRFGIVDGRSVKLTEYGADLVERGRLDYGQWSWVDPDDERDALTDGWNFIGRSLEGQGLYWRPMPVRPAEGGSDVNSR